MRIFVTGGAGFIGSHTVDALVACGLDVRIYDDLSTGALGNLRGLEEREQFVRGDVLDYPTLLAAMAGCDAVLHLAAVVSVPLSISDMPRAHAVNATGTLNVLEAAKAAGIRRVVLASSAAVYGDTEAPALFEDLPPRIRSPYAGQKWLNEVYAQTFARYHGLSPVCLRYFNVYGPRQDPRSPYSGVLSRFIAAAVAGEPVTIHGDGRQSRDFVYVQDVAAANRRALLAPDHATGMALNVGTGRGVAIADAYQRIVALLAAGAAPAPRWEPERPGDVRRSLADVRLARELLGFEARTPFEEGLAQTIAWARRERPEPAGTRVEITNQPAYRFVA